MTMRIIRIALATLLLCFIVPGVAQADIVGFEYSGSTFTQLSHPGAYSGPATAGTLVTGVNDNGQIVGYYQSSNTTATPYEYGYLLAHRTFTDLNYPAAHLVSTQAAGINDHNQIVGGYIVNSTPAARHGFLYSQGIYRTIDFPGSMDTYLRAINDGGQIIGNYFSSTNSTFIPFLLSDGRFFTLPLYAAYGINDRGEIVGESVSNKGVLYNFFNGTSSTIAYPGALFTYPIGINDRGQIVGFYNVCTSTLVTGQCFTASVHGFLLNGDTYSTIDYPGGSNSFTYLYGISNNGTIVGLTESRVSPVPEPSTFMMLGAGLLPVIGVIRRRYLNR